MRTPQVGRLKNTTPISAKASVTSSLECPVVIFGWRSMYRTLLTWRPARPANCSCVIPAKALAAASCRPVRGGVAFIAHSGA